MNVQTTTSAGDYTGESIKSCTIDQLISRIKDSGKSYNTDKIRAAYEFANAAHEGQLRKSGEPYITHPLMVAYILLDYNMDTDALVAALLHDVVEDTHYTDEDIRKKFGEDVAILVDGLTKIKQLPLSTKEEKVAESVRKMLLTMTKDIRVIVIKLADRLHNMRTLEFK